MQMCQQEMVADMHIVHITSAYACFIVLSGFTLKKIKQDFKDKTIKYYKIAIAEH